MLQRVLGVLCILAFAAPAAAQWQPLDGGSGGVVPTPSTPPATSQPSAPGTGIQVWGTPPAPSPTPTPTPTPPTPTPPTPTPTVTPPVTPPPGPAPGGAAIEIRYSGQAAQDPRKASMRLIINGGTATANVSMQSICAQNVHVGGADIQFTGTLSGPWEGKGSAISGTWKGIDHHCGSDDPNQGQFTFFLKDSAYGGPVLHLRLDGKNGRYGWNFKPTGKVYTGGGAGGPTIAALGSGFTSPIGRPGPNYRAGNTTPSFAGSGGGGYDDQLRRNFLGGIITLQVGDTHLQSLPGPTSSRLALDPQSGSTYTNTDNCRPSGGPSIFMSPSSLADAQQVGNAIRLTGRTRGKGELWIGGSSTCTRPNGSTYSMRTVLIYIVLVGNAAIDDFRQQQGGGTAPPTASPGDVAQAEVSGYALMADTGEPVSGALVTLVTEQGTGIQDPAWKTRGDGSFVITAGSNKNLRSGRYEVLVQKLRQGPVPGRCEPVRGTPAGIGNDCDLWPVRKFFVQITRDAPRANAGTIQMNFVRNIDFTNRKAGAQLVDPSTTQPPGGDQPASQVFPSMVPYPKSGRFR